jgi:hypothetical protein
MLPGCGATSVIAENERAANLRLNVTSPIGNSIMMSSSITSSLTVSVPAWRNSGAATGGAVVATCARHGCWALEEGETANARGEPPAITVKKDV